MKYEDVYTASIFAWFHATTIGRLPDAAALLRVKQNKTTAARIINIECDCVWIWFGMLLNIVFLCTNRMWSVVPIESVGENCVVIFPEIQFQE
jgi:hypothetical protein